MVGVKSGLVIDVRQGGSNSGVLMGSSFHSVKMEKSLSVQHGRGGGDECSYLVGLVIW